MASAGRSRSNREPTFSPEHLKARRRIFSKTKAMLRQQKRLLKSKKKNVLKNITPHQRCSYHLDCAKLLFHQGLVVESIVELKAMRDRAPDQERRRVACMSLEHHQQHLVRGKNPKIAQSIGVEKACNFCGTLEDMKLKKCGTNTLLLVWANFFFLFSNSLLFIHFQQRFKREVQTGVLLFGGLSKKRFSNAQEVLH